jgi:hypothetical protein
MHRGPPAAPTGGGPPGGFFSHDQVGQLLVMSNPHFVFRCEPNSSIAGCAQELWHREQAHWRDRATVLYRVPNRKELCEYLCTDEPTITKLCRDEGFGWLPRALPSRGRRR